MKEQIAEVEEILEKEYGFRAHTEYNFVHRGWVEDWLKTNTPEETARLYDERCQSLQRGEIATFQAKHSAMSNAAAEAYANNWN